jgi:ABC-type polar amino acid transport system ATPase subunit
VMPHRHIVEITQHFYWPLHSRPIDWIEQRHHGDQEDLRKIARRIAGELHSLEFIQVATPSSNATSDDEEAFPVSDAIEAEATISKIVDELLEEKDDWFQQLSGGQRSKVELVRLVFLREECPAVLLIDETLAPLDPRSKQLVMTKIKLFCSSSIIIVIYHADVGTDNDKEACIASSNFFDRNIHLESGDVHIRDVC